LFILEFAVQALLALLVGLAVSVLLSGAVLALA
jgi:hypothetical protein